MRTLAAFRSWRSIAPLVVVLLALTAPAGTLAAGKTAKSVGAGDGHACAVRSDGTAWCWGSNLHFELGNKPGGENHSSTPLEVQLPDKTPLTKVTAIAGGREHTCAIRQDKKVWCWGQPMHGELGQGNTDQPLGAVEVQSAIGGLRATAIGAGMEFTCALRIDQTVWCWGSNYYGQLGDDTGSTDRMRLLPVQVVSENGPLTNVTSIGVGWSHACAVLANGTAWCWGHADGAQLGTGFDPHYVTHAVQVMKDGKPFTNVESISPGTAFTCAVRTNGTVWCWGYNDAGEVGQGAIGTEVLSPVQIRRATGRLTGVRSVSADHAYTSAGWACALLDVGTVWCWGAAGAGNLGDGTTGGPTHIRSRAVQVRLGRGMLTGVRSLAVGGGSACAVTSDGKAWCWGSNDDGNLGDGSANPVQHNKPVRVHLPT